MEEIFDIYTEDKKLIGQATREEVHKKGYWHQTFHCWVCHETPVGSYLLLQLRHPSKDTHPNELDISCAGHLETGERPEDGIRELKEELGLEVAIEDLHQVGVYKYSDKTAHVQDNEFCHVFVYLRETDNLEDYAPQMDEVSGLYLIELDDMKKLVRKEQEKVRIKGFEMGLGGRKVYQERSMGLHDLVKNESRYYEMLFDCLNKLV